MNHVGAGARLVARRRLPVRMGARVGREEGLPLARREVADLEHEIDVTRRDRRVVSRRRDLRDEAAVLGKRRGDPLPRAGRPRFENALQDCLVFGDAGARRVDAALGALTHRAASARSRP